MRVFSTPNGNIYHIVKSIQENPTYPYNHLSHKVQAFCPVHCEKSNAIIFEYDHSDNPAICTICLEKYRGL